MVPEQVSAKYFVFCYFNKEVVQKLKFPNNSIIVSWAKTYKTKNLDGILAYENGKIKPEIPNFAENGIEIRDETEFEMKLIEIMQVFENKEKYMDILLLGDEQENMIKKYLYRGELFALFENDLKTVSVVTQEDEKIYEIKNIATYEKYQNNGYGSIMIRHIIEHIKNKGKKLLIGTGEDEKIISFYNKFGFEYSHTIKDFFIDNYDHEMYEKGKQLRDMIYLKMDF